MGSVCRPQEAHVGSVGKQAVMEPRIFINSSRHAKPKVADLWLGCGFKEVHRIYVANLYGTRSREVFPEFLRHFVGHRCTQLFMGWQAFGTLCLGHFVLVVPTAFFDMEGAGHVENLFAVLDCNDSSCGEAAAVARTIDFVDDRDFWVAGPNEISMKRVAVSIFNGPISRDECLCDHLATKNTLARLFIGAFTAEKIDLKTLQVEKREQFGNSIEFGCHGGPLTPAPDFCEAFKGLHCPMRAEPP